MIAQENDRAATVAMEIPPGTKVIADEEYLTRALANLVRNAIRYASTSGPIRVIAKDHVITVRDSGQGLPEEVLSTVFNPFYRPGAARTPGTGGGLAIVKSCVDACNGKVYCRNLHPIRFEVVIELGPMRPR